ncbi:Transcription factor bHLH110 [Linum perenne]
MESSPNLGRHHHHPHQEQQHNQQLQAQVVASSTSTTSSSSSAPPHNFTLYNNSNTQINNDLSFQWNNHSGCFTSASADHQGSDDLTSSTSSDPFPRFTHMLITSSPTTTSADDATSSSSAATAFPFFLAPGGGGGFPFMNTHPSPPAVYGSNSNANFMLAAAAGGARCGSSNGSVGSSLIYPSINVSSLAEGAPMEDMMSLEATMDLFTSSARFTNHFGDSTLIPHGGGVDHNHYPMRQYSNPTTTTTAAKVSSGTKTEAKRCSSGTSSSNEAPPGKQASGGGGGDANKNNKKSRLLEQPRASCPPFKVRKEKLGDRIASLQQLVAPFGKTDTASVLMEAIGYIKFLQNQVEVSDFICLTRRYTIASIP